MLLRGDYFVSRMALYGAVSALAFSFSALTALAADEPADATLVSASANVSDPAANASDEHRVTFGAGVVAMAPIPDKKPAKAKVAAAAEAPSEVPATEQETGVAYYSPINPNPSLTGEPAARTSMTIRDGVVMMAPVSDGGRERLAVNDAQPRSALSCLAKAVYFEARGESVKGQEAVAQVVLARTKAPDRPKTVCGVVYEGSDLDTGCQFSFTCDGIADVVRDQAAWARARRIASLAMAGKLKRVARGATYFHARYVRPNWASHMVRVATIGTHIFYRP